MSVKHTAPLTARSVVSSWCWTSGFQKKHSWIYWNMEVFQMFLWNWREMQPTSRSILQHQVHTKLLGTADACNCNLRFFVFPSVLKMQREFLFPTLVKPFLTTLPLWTCSLTSWILLPIWFVQRSDFQLFFLVRCLTLNWLKRRWQPFSA